ncbi:MAG: hypothetical protein ACI9NC_004684 [Verrucomicrobiales bacterium]|jgi:hypothetical protein
MPTCSVIPHMKYAIIALGCAGMLTSCTSLPRPEITSETKNQPGALQLVRESSQQAGNPYQRLSRVDVCYDGEWANLATRIQPVVTDPEFRKVSDESYFPKQLKVRQVYRGTGGEKIVTRTGKSITVTRNGKRIADQEELDAAALVADCYVVFTFGSSALLERGSGWRSVGKRKLGGESCTLVAGTVRPGFGNSEADAVIVWIGDESKRLHRVQLTLLGLASTAGADVDVSFNNFQPGPFGTEWPRAFDERIRRPFDIPAHVWRMEELKARR